MVKTLIIIAVIAGGLVAVRLFLPGLSGVIGAARVSSRLSMLPRSEYIVINDVTVTTQQNKVLIPHVVVSRFGIFIVNTKNIGGRIFGTDSDEKWIRRTSGKERYFRNPLGRCSMHISLLRSVTGLPSKVFFPVIVFTGGASVWTESVWDITTPFYVNKVIKAHSSQLLSESEMQKVAIQISELY